MKTLLAAAVACALLAPAVGRAQPVLGAQAGLFAAAGEIERGERLRDQLRLSIPLELRLGWRFSPRIVVGLQGGYGIGIDGEAWRDFCSASGVRCSMRSWRAAVRGEYAFDGSQVRPWLAATLGWEWLRQRWEASEDNWERTLWSGWLLGVEGGFDVPVSKRFGGGVFVGAALGELLTASTKGENAGFAYADEGAVREPALHLWVGAGARLTFEP